jgi:imidazoleglycerol-phosphate dehydratase
VSRKGRVARTTKESDVLVEINLDGTGEVTVDTGVPFYDHMLSQLGKHGAFDLNVKTKGDISVDEHHTIEDTALALELHSKKLWEINQVLEDMAMRLCHWMKF